MLKTNIIWPKSRYYKSATEWEPISFFSECLLNATHFDLMLGFFSSSAISILSDGFALFLYNGGCIRLIINDILTEQDKTSISKGQSEEIIHAFNLSNIEELKETLSIQDIHFFECLSWLIRNNRIEIKMITTINGIGMAHTKCGVFSDGVNKVAFNGSCNFTRTALVSNIEDITASCDWDGETIVARINQIEADFQNTFKGENTTVKYVDAGHVRTFITNAFQPKDLNQLLEDEYALINTKQKLEMRPAVVQVLNKARTFILTEIVKYKKDKQPSTTNRNKPHFPYPEGPRDYQKLAFDNWKKNNQKGLFAMATGTGKTITSLNCLLEIYNRCGYYKAIILVPTITLINQWEKECKKFSFDNITKVYSKNSKWKNEIDSIKLNEKLKDKDNSISYVIISTYASFAKSDIFSTLSELPKKKLLLIADEAHNMGSGQIRNKLDGIPYARRIGLSATPERQFDNDGNKALMKFFGSEEKYTYEYSMKEAIDKGVLCRYYYYPHLVKLTDVEMSEYTKLSIQISKYYNFSKNSFAKSSDILTALLLKRKRIIHKAENKKSIFQQIITKQYEEKGNLKYTLVYVPEGSKPDNNEADMFDVSENINDDDYSEHLIDQYTQIVRDIDSHITVRKFTSSSNHRDEILDEFSNGNIEVLTSMKCLDEGVDVPRSELAIFCASTGNPRQFIQRRGRILRIHKHKHFAIIHDLVVAPEISSTSQSYKMEKNLLESELTRVRNFSLLSENSNDTIDELGSIINYYNLSLF
jgi:superfamily II DNA or RNA helicase